MSFFKLIKYNPVLSYTMVWLLTRIVVISLGVNYDSPGWRGALFWISQFFSGIVWLVFETFHGFIYLDSYLLMAIVIAVSIILSSLLDYIYRQIFKIGASGFRVG